MRINKEIYIIRTPIWKGREVGIAVFRFKGLDAFRFEIAHKTVDGQTLYPQTYQITTEKARTFPVKPLSPGGPMGYWFPIGACDVIEKN